MKTLVVGATGLLGPEICQRLTAAGQKALAAEIDEWTRFTTAVGLVIVAEA